MNPNVQVIGSVGPELKFTVVFMDWLKLWPRNLCKTILFVSVDSFSGPTHWVFLLIYSPGNDRHSTMCPDSPAMMSYWGYYEVLLIQAGLNMTACHCVWGCWLLASAEWSHWLSAIGDGFHLCLRLNVVDLSKGAEEEKKGRKEENADWLAAESRGVVHELSP